jgi:hypothetical protein
VIAVVHVLVGCIVVHYFWRFVNGHQYNQP